MNKIEFLTYIQSLIKDPEVRNIVGSILATTGLKVFERPASSSGKYHPYETRGENGLMKHTIYVINSALVLMDADKWYDKHPIHRDLVIAACALHDILKYGTNNESEHTVSDHPELAYQLIHRMSYNLNYLGISIFAKWIRRRYTRYIAKLVRSHHGKWGDHPCNTRDKQIVHSADMIASRLHKIEMRPEVPSRSELNELVGTIAKCSGNLVNEVFAELLLQLYAKGPSTKLDECFEYALKEWNN